MKIRNRCDALATLFLTTTGLSAPLPIAELKRDTPVDFTREVRPFLSDNCFSCHCQTTTKGGLNMETPALMLKGGDSGPAIVAGKSAESLVLKAAAHFDEDLAMPPRDNKAKAKNLAPEQLALLRHWIDQGAKPSPKTDRTLAWQPLAENIASILAVAISPDGQFAACARGGRVFIYHVPSGRLVANEAAHRDQVNALAFSPDGTLLASAAYREVKLWRRAKTEGQQAPPPVAPDFSKTARTEGKTLFILKDGNPAAQADHGEAITAFAVRPDGQRFATAGGNFAKLWAADGKLIAELKKNRIADELAAARERALQVATGTVAFRKEAVTTAEKAVAAAGERVKKATDAIPPKQTDLDAKTKAAADAKAALTALEQSLTAADAEFKKAEAALPGAADKAAQAAAKVAESLKAATAVDAEKVAAEASALLAEAAKLRVARDKAAAAQKDATTKLEPAKKAFTAAETAMKAATTARAVADTELELAKAEEKKNAATVAAAKSAVEAAEAARKKAEDDTAAAKQAATAAAAIPVRAVAFSPDGSTLATAGDDGFLRTWSADSGAAFDVVSAGKIAALTPGPGAVISTGEGGTTLAWRLAPAWTLERAIGTGDAGSPFADRVSALAFSPDGKLLATGGGEPSREGELKLWDAATGAPARELARVHSDSVLSVEFSPDGAHVATGAADRMARITDVATGKVARTFEGHTNHVAGVSWSADGRTVATAGAEGMVKVWDFTTGERRKNIEGWEKEVTAVRFVAATTTLLTSAGDSRVRLVATDGKEVRTFPETSDFMHAAAATADGKLVVAGGQDGVLRVWNAADGAKVLSAK